MNIKFSIFLLFISVNCFAHHPGNKIDAEKPYYFSYLEIIKDKQIEKEDDNSLSDNSNDNPILK
jgi:hypothetical protein